MASSTYLSRALLRSIGRRARRKAAPPHRRLCRRLWLHQDTGITGKIVMPGDAAQAQLEPDAGRKPASLVHLHRLKADIVRIFQHRDRAGAVEGDIEFARQAVKRAIIENMEMPFARERAGIDQLLRIDACRRRAGDVADIVSAGAARAEAEILNGLDQRDGVMRFDLADL
jgi:hypothetical protein